MKIVRKENENKEIILTDKAKAEGEVYLIKTGRKVRYPMHLTSEK